MESCRGIARALGALVLVVVLGACSLAEYKPPPKYPAQVPLTVSPEPITERPGADYNIPDSQVHFRNAVAARRMLMGAAMLGADRRASRIALGDSAGDIALKFDASVREWLDRMTKLPANGARFRTVADPAVPAVTLFPGATLSLLGEDIVTVEFELIVRNREGLGDTIQSRRYFYAAADAHPLAGWANANGVALRSVAARAFPRLLELMLDDIEGRLPNANLSAGAKRVTWISPGWGEVMSTRLVRESSDHIVVAPQNGWAVDNPTYLGIVERALVRP